MASNHRSMIVHKAVDDLVLIEILGLAVMLLVMILFFYMFLHSGLVTPAGIPFLVPAHP